MTSHWIRDLRTAYRTLLRTPGFAGLAVLTLGLAIGANAGIFSVVETVLLDPLPFQATDRLVYIGGTAPGSDLPEEFPLSAEFFLQYQEQSKSLENLALFNSFTSTLRVGDRIERVRMSAPTLSLFDTLGAQPILGRLPTPDEEDRVVVISHSMWKTWLGSDPDVLGKAYYVSGEDRTVVGVMAPDFWFPNDGTLLWFPQTVREEGLQVGRFGQPMVARMAPGVGLETLTAELKLLAQPLPERYGASANYERFIGQFRPVIRPLEEHILGDTAGPLWILLAAVGIVLLIACANVANLFMVRAEQRLPDLAVRRALGAGRGRLITSQMAEAAIIAALAGVFAVVLARIAVPLLLAAAPGDVPRLDQVAIRPSTLLFTFAVSILAALLCGLLPAVRSSAPNLAQLREGGRGSLRQSRWGRNTLVIGQTALALVLLIASALLLRSFDKLSHVDPGYDTDDIFTFQFAPEGAHLQDAPSYARLHTDFLDRLAALPGVENVGIVENVPLDEGLATQRFETETTAGDEDGGTLLLFTYSAGDYFSTMGIDVLQGRPFLREDQLSGSGHVVISRSAADLLWPNQDPIGQRLRIVEREEWETVIGVVEDILQYGFRQAPEPMVYFPLVGQNLENSRPVSSPGYVVKTARAHEIAPEVRALVREVAPTAPMYRVYTMEGLASRSMVQLSFTALTLGIASILALILGVVGPYGVLSYAVAERTREIGLRMALGAAASRVRQMVVGEGARVLAVGVVVGSGVAFLATRALDRLLFEMESFDPVTYGAVSILMVLVGLVACYLPAHRASKVDPMVALRAE